jgi:hypothetical protein
LLGAGLAVAASLVARAALDLRGLAVDDAYIHLHIARNWAEGNGPVFNVGERVEASTSPGWLALLALGLQLGLSGPAVATATEVMSTALAGAGVAMLAADMGGALAGVVAAAALALLPAFSVWGASGLETPLAVAGVAWAMLLVGRARTARGVCAVGGVAALLATVRPETLTLAPVLLFLAARNLPAEGRLRAIAAGIVCVGVPMGALLLARHAYFGEWVPNTYVAKVQGIDMAHRLLGIRYIAKFAVVHLPLLAAVALLDAPTRKRLLPAAIAMVVLLAAVAWTGGDHFYYERLAVPTLGLFCLPVALVAAGSSGPRRLAALGLVAAGLPFGVFLTGDRGAVIEERDATRILEDVGRDVEGLPPGSVASIGIGAPAWFSRRPVLDLVGLADAHIARSPRFPGAKSGHEHGDADYVMQRAPDYVLLFFWPTAKPVDDADEMRQLSGLMGCCQAALQLIKHPQFRARYEPFDILVAGGQHQRMWRRRGLPGFDVPAAAQPAGAP